MGLTMLPVTRLNATVHTAMIATSDGDPVAIVSSSAIPVEMNPPTYGMKHRKKDSTNTGRASGIPSTSMITSWLPAPTNEMAAVPLM